MFSRIRKRLAYIKYCKLKNNSLFNKKMWNLSKPYVELNNEVKKEKNELKEEKTKSNRLTWGKFLLLFLFINFTILEIFVGWVTVQSFTLGYAIGTAPDFTPLITLLSLVLGETLSYGIYCYKAKAENTKNGIIFETAMKELERFNDDQEQGGVG